MKRAGLFLTVALAGVALIYWSSLDDGFHYDDYHLFRPWTAIDLRRVWYGSWDPTGIESVFYRPLAAYLFALQFWLFGVNTAALHLTSLIGHAAAAALLAWFVSREGAPLSTSAFAAWLYAVHPAFPFAQVSWLTNQMHLAESLVVISALLIWQSVRHRGVAWWLPLFVLVAVAFLLKEDGIMLAPAIAVLTLLTPTPAAGRQRRWPIVMVGVATMAALLALRYDRLGELGGYGVPELRRAIENGLKGLESVVALWPTRRRWQGTASVIAVAVVVGALAAGGWRRASLAIGGSVLVVALAFNVRYLTMPSPGNESLLALQGIASGIAIASLCLGVGAAVYSRNRQAGRLIAMGLLLALCFDAPFVLVTKREQYHLVALGAVLALVGAADAVGRGRRASMRWVAPALVTIPLIGLARIYAGEFDACAHAAEDRDITGWWVVPRELGPWIERNVAACEAGSRPLEPLAALPVIVWGAQSEERPPDAPPWRWTSDDTLIRLSATHDHLDLALRRPDASVGSPVHVTIESGGRLVDARLTSGDWQRFRIPLSRSVLTALRDGHHVRLETSDWYVPAVRDPRSTDLRRYGVQMRVEHPAP